MLDAARYLLGGMQAQRHRRMCFTCMASAAYCCMPPARRLRVSDTPVWIDTAIVVLIAPAFPGTDRQHPDSEWAHNDASTIFLQT